MDTSPIRVLVVDDFEPFRRFVCTTLQNKLGLRTVLEVSDGLKAIELAQALQPELILLDIQLPKLNGIEAGRRIRAVAPQSKIIFVSQQSSAHIVQAAFSLGASGYVVKTDARRELPAAVQAVLRGERFVGSKFAGHSFTGASDAGTPGGARGKEVAKPLLGQTMEVARVHEVGFYSDDESLLDGFTQFIGAALKGGNAVIVLTTELHRGMLLSKLQAHGWDLGAAVDQGRYVSLDVAEVLSTFMISDQPDPVRFLKGIGGLVGAAAKAANGESPHLVACGECAPLLWAQGNAEAAIRVEHLWNEIAKTYDMDTLCGYPLGSFHAEHDRHVFQRICAEHSAVHYH